jgi:ribosome-associated heat shock protein Hsp15
MRTPPLRRSANHRAEMSPADPSAAVRIDRWLWAARAFRSRSQAAQACDGGKVTINGSSAKPHKLVRPGDLIEITVSGGKRRWRLREIAERRGPAAVARALYDDLTPPPAPEPVDAFPRRVRGSGRPTKRERRQLDRLR